MSFNEIICVPNHVLVALWGSFSTTKKWNHNVVLRGHHCAIAGYATSCDSGIPYEGQFVSHCTTSDPAHSVHPAKAAHGHTRVLEPATQVADHNVVQASGFNLTQPWVLW